MGAGEAARCVGAAPGGGEAVRARTRTRGRRPLAQHDAARARDVRARRRARTAARLRARRRAPALHPAAIQHRTEARLLGYCESNQSRY